MSDHPVTFGGGVAGKSDDIARLVADVAHLAAIVESSDDAIISKDLNGVIISWNRGAERIFGYKPGEAIGRSITMLIPEDRLDEEPEILSRIRRGEKVDHFETVRRRKDGTLLNISLTISPIFGPNGEVIGASKIARDITERKAAEQKLSMLAAIVESSDDAIISKNLDGIIQSWNRGAERVFGYTAEEAIGRSVTMLIPEDRFDEEPRILERIRAGEKIDHYETVRRRKDGMLIDISLSVSPIHDGSGRIVGASKIARDITERVRAERARREKETMQRLVDAQEAERNRIARDLHDHLGQKMTGLRLKIESIERSTADPAFAADIAAIKSMSAEIDRDIGFLSWELRPTELENVGLEGALRSFTREWSTQYAIRAEFHANTSEAKPGRLPPELETNIYRVLQEALNNVLKHAKATFVSVIFHHRRDDIVLVVEDNGKGFDPAASRNNGGKIKGLGLMGMNERAAMLHGSLEIESRPGEGTTLIAKVPIAAAAVSV